MARHLQGDWKITGNLARVMQLLESDGIPGPLPLVQADEQGEQLAAERACAYQAASHPASGCRPAGGVTARPAVVAGWHRANAARSAGPAGMLIAMRETARLAGFFAAHGIWSIAGGGTLTPLLGYQQPGGGRGMDRFAAEDTAEAVRAGQDALQANRRGSVRAVLVTDAYIRLGTGRSDALIVEAVEYSAARQSMTMAIPYRPQSSPHGFAVYRPKFIEVTGVDEPDYGALADAFFAGVDSHEQAAAVWNAHLDQAR